MVLPLNCFITPSFAASNNFYFLLGVFSIEIPFLFQVIDSFPDSSACFSTALSWNGVYCHGTLLPYHHQQQQQQHLLLLSLRNWHVIWFRKELFFSLPSKFRQLIFFHKCWGASRPILAPLPLRSLKFSFCFFSPSYVSSLPLPSEFASFLIPAVFYQTTSAISWPHVILFVW